MNITEDQLLMNIFSTKNIFSGRDCIIVGCGPSAVHWESVIRRCSQPVVVAIKQSYNYLPKGLVDLHFYNAHNCKNYYTNTSYRPNYFSIFQDDLDGPRQFNPFDIRTCVTKSRENPWKDCLALNKDIEKYTITSSGYRRPWGPGILFESVFYIIEFMGLRNITTIGFDNGFSELYNHFYSNQSSKHFNKGIKKLADPTTVNYFRHQASLNYNVGMKPMQTQGFDEPLLIKELTSLFHNWFAQKDVSLKIFTDFSGCLEENTFIQNVSS
jgi:hypothetical protein